MRQIVCISLKEETLAKLQNKIEKNPSYRNKSHFVEEAIRRALEE
jgi:Arc/MetJ-type ribon-helix-helix transcriptional regulator